jgi:DNA (cytosine-5)-methyltransferase 1
MKSPSDVALASARRFLSVKDIARTVNRSEGTVYRWLEKGGSDSLIIPALNARLNSNGEGTPNPEFTFIDLFAGIGGIRKGFEAHGGRCVWTSEWDKYSVQTYKANFPDCHEIAGDITKVDAANIPDHDVLLGGFPCQPFSLAGVSKKNALGKLHGFLDETQGTLFFDVARIIDQKRPKAFMLENVKNLLSHDKGRTFAVIQRTLEGLGYKLHCRIINAIHWVPQHRQRIIIVGFREAVSFTWKDLREPEFGPKLGSILHTADEIAESPYTEGYRNKTRVAPKYTLTDHLWTYLQNYAKKHAAKGNGFGCSVVKAGDTTRTLSARYHKDGSEILVFRGTEKNPRRLTPRECARLMGFDAPGTTTPMIIPVSDTQAYRQFGNSVAVPVFKEVARIMVPHLAGIGESSADRPSGLLPYQYQPELMAV